MDGRMILTQYATEASFYDGPFGGGAPWLSAGMGYVILCPSGELLVVDGGHAADAEPFLKLLREVSGCETPRVDTWILTHPHNDHYGALYGICSNDALRGSVYVSRLVYRFPEEFTDDEGEGIGYVFPIMDTVLAATGAEHVTPERGDAFECGGVKVEMLYVPDDCSWLDGPNQLSLIFTVTDGSAKITFTGDAGRRNLEYVLEHSGESLAGDVLQLPHHGLCDTGHRGFYEAVGADVVLIPTSAAGYKSMRSGIYGDATADNEYAESRATRVYRSFDGTAQVEL